MKFTLKDLDWAVDTNVISGETRDVLAGALERRYEETPHLSFANVLYYLGGLIVIGAMTFYATMAWGDLGGIGHALMGLFYSAIFLFAGNRLWKNKGQRIPGGILITAAVCMTPLVVYGFQEASGWWVFYIPGMYLDFYRWIEGGWFFMEVATMVAGVIALRFYKFPFITLPIAFSLWFLSMDLTAVIYGPAFSWDERKMVSLVFGAAMLVGSFVVDRRTRDDFAFWGYLFGMLAFWGALTSMDSDSELGKFIYCVINLGLMGLSVLLQRRVFIVFGSLGVFIYLAHLADDVFNDTLGFTFALVAIGLAVMGLGLQYHKHRKAIETKLMAALPEAIKRALPQYRTPPR